MTIPDGGFAIGMAQHGLSASQAANSYILLAVGDALVAQIPGLLISVAAAMVVSRVGKEHDMGGQIVRQLLMSPRVLGVTAAILILLGIIPGMPHTVFLLMGSGLGYCAWLLLQKQNQPAPEPEAPPAPTNDGEASWESSSQGISIAVAAPSEDMVGALPGDRYAAWAGTSAATPVVAGAAALVQAKWPELSAEEVAHRLTATARDAGAPGKDHVDIVPAT